MFRALLVGCGSISKGWMKAIKKIGGIEVVGFVDLNEDAARMRAAEFGVEGTIVGTNLSAVLEKTRPDVVLDCTIPEAHVIVTCEALKRGCHVFGEKPLADSMENARKSVAAAKKAGKVYAVSQQRRFNLQARRLKQFIDSGAIGDVTTVNSDFYIGAHFEGFRTEMGHVLLLDMAIHTFDIARFLSGANPVAVQCLEWNPEKSWYKHGASAVAVFEMTAGIVYTYRGSWCSEGFTTPWESEWRIIGTKGSVMWDGAREVKAQVATEKRSGLFLEPRDVEIPLYKGNEEESDRIRMTKHFFECLKTGKAPETVCTDNIKSLAMVFGAIESTETGARSEISA